MGPGFRQDDEKNQQQGRSHAYPRGRRWRHRRLFWWQAVAGRPRRHLPGPAAARQRARERRPRHQKPERRRDLEKSADHSGRRAQGQVRRRAAELQGLRPRRRHQVVRGSSRAQYGDHPDAQRHEASRYPRRQVRQGARARWPLRHRRDAQREARGGAAPADAVDQLRRARRRAVGSRQGDRRGLQERHRWGHRQPEHHARHVGKWVFLSSLAASTSLMRTSVGNILAAPGGRDFLLGMLDETSAIAAASGYTPGGPFFERVKGNLTTEGSPMTASMFRDVKAGLPVEADHVIGDLIARADAAKVPVPKLRIAYTHLKAYEKQRAS